MARVLIVVVVAVMMIVLLTGCAECGLCRMLGICPKPPPVYDPNQVPDVPAGPFYEEHNDANDVDGGLGAAGSLGQRVWLWRCDTERQVQPSP